MQNEWVAAILIGIGFGLLIGVYVARKSMGVRPVQAGAVAKALHYFACSALSATTPYILAGLIVGLHFFRLFGTAVAFFSVGGVLLLIYGTLEANAPTARRQ